MTPAICSLSLILWTSAPAPESYFGAHTSLPQFSAEVDEFDGDDEVAGGVLVFAVVENSPAAQAGLQPGDRVVAFNDHPVRSPAQLQQLVRATTIGADVVTRVVRDDRLLDLKSRTVRRLVPRIEPSVRGHIESRRLGVVVEDVRAAASETAGLAGVRGVRLRRLLKGSPVSPKRLRRGDLILAVNDENVYGGEDFLVLVDRLGGGEKVELGVRRGEQDLNVKLTTRDPGAHIAEFSLPLLIDYEREPHRRRTKFGLLPFDMIKYERNENEREYCILWFICCQTGSNDELEEME